MGAKCRHAEPQCFSTVISRIQRPCSAGILPPYAAPLLGRSLSVSQQSGTARQLASSAPLLGTASPWSYLPAIPPGLAPFQSPCGPLIAFADASATLRSVLN